MGRFHFHLRAGDELTLDDVGAEFADLSAARLEAEASARELLAEAIKGRKTSIPDAFVITNPSGHELGTVLLKGALPESWKKQLL